MEVLKPTTQAPPRSQWKLTSSTLTLQSQVNPFYYRLSLVFYYSSMTFTLSLRLLLLEEHNDWFLVHAVAVWSHQQIWERAGASAHLDACEPQGGSRLRVCLHAAWLWCKEANPLHRVNADQRDVFFLMGAVLTPIGEARSWVCDRF